MSDKKEYHTLLAEAENALADGTHTAITDRIALRDAVCIYLTAEREKGTTVETVLRSVEAILTQASDRGGNGNSDGHHQLAQQIVDWCARKARSLWVC